MNHHPVKTASLNVIARAPFQIYYEGVSTMVSAANEVGNFDILPGHADFFSVLIAGDVVIETEKEPVLFHITNGIISVHNSDVMLFVNI